METNRYIFKIYYIGSVKYYGSQRQIGYFTIEECIINALTEKGYIKNFKNSGFEFASRTDRFVSARGACFSFISEKKPILMEINSSLPEDIGIWAYSKVPIDFSSRFNAILRHYKYIVATPIKILQKQFPISLDLMEKACNELIGYHDFINFSKRGKKEENTHRNIEYAKISMIKDFLVFDFKSKAFLRQQVRRMVKKIIDLGIGEIQFNDFLKLLDNTDYYSYQPAEPKGVILWDINYGDKVKFIIDPLSKKRMDNYFFQQELDNNFKSQFFDILQNNN
ncbi:MAG: tRNA pseudouridine(38-40) synthase TruA [Promethearchaeota archaeon]